MPRCRQSSGAEDTMETIPGRHDRLRLGGRWASPRECLLPMAAWTSTAALPFGWLPPAHPAAHRASCWPSVCLMARSQGSYADRVARDLSDVKGRRSRQGRQRLESAVEKAGTSHGRRRKSLFFLFSFFPSMAEQGLAENIKAVADAWRGLIPLWMPARPRSRRAPSRDGYIPSPCFSLITS